jgi:hypothetical protein
MNQLSFGREDVRSKTLISIHVPFVERNSIDFRIPLTVTSKITNRSIVFKHDAEKTVAEYEVNEGWDGEEYHIYFADTEDRNILVDVWYSPNL